MVLEKVSLSEVVHTLFQSEESLLGVKTLLLDK